MVVSTFGSSSTTRIRTGEFASVIDTAGGGVSCCSNAWMQNPPEASKGVPDFGVTAADRKLHSLGYTTTVNSRCGADGLVRVYFGCVAKEKVQVSAPATPRSVRLQAALCDLPNIWAVGAS